MGKLCTLVFVLLAATSAVVANAAHGRANIDEITFYTYTRSNPDQYVQIWVGNMSTSLMDPTKPTKFLTHGFTDDAFSGWMESAKDAFLRVEDCNVVLIDWSGITFYFNVDRCGRYVAELYDYLATQGFNTEDFYCSGHSLGAHVCGYSGKGVTAGTLGRITGLDPSLPSFNISDPTTRLADTDADVVDIIHTCGGDSGFLDPIGKADFFPNGGTPGQPGCGIEIGNICSHVRARALFIESIETTDFRSRQCDSWEDYQNGVCSTNPTASMGATMDLSTRGNYYLRTNGKEPFAIG